MQVLHVDDDAAFSDLVATYLARESERIDVVTATGADEGLEAFEAHDVDCVVSDYDMPGTDGLEFLGAVRERQDDVPFILFTGKGSEEVASEAFSAGATDYLQKKGHGDQYTLLANRVEHAVENARSVRERRRRLEAIESAREGISILDDAGYFTFVNRAYADLYGYEPDELVGEHFEITYPESEVAFAYDVVIPAVEAEGFWQGESVGLRADGTTFLEDHVVADAGVDGRVCTVLDASERRATESDLHRFRAMADALPVPVCVYDAAGRVRAANEALGRALDATPDALVGRAGRLVETLRSAAEGDPFADLVAGERETFVGVYALEHADGRPLEREYHLSRIEHDGVFEGVVAVARDVPG